MRGGLTKRSQGLNEHPSCDQAEQGTWPADLWQQLEENGLTQPLAPEELGGLGAGFAEAFVIAFAAGSGRGGGRPYLAARPRQSHEKNGQGEPPPPRVPRFAGASAVPARLPCARSRGRNCWESQPLTPAPPGGGARRGELNTVPTLVPNVGTFAT